MPEWGDPAASEKAQAHAKREPVPLEERCPEVPGGLAFVVAKMMAKHPTERFQTAGEVAGWRGEVGVVPEGRIPVPYRFEQDLDTDSRRIRQELRFAESVTLTEALERTIAWERANPPEQPSSVPQDSHSRLRIPRRLLRLDGRSLVGRSGTGGHR